MAPCLVVAMRRLAWARRAWSCAWALAVCRIGAMPGRLGAPALCSWSLEPWMLAGWRRYAEADLRMSDGNQEME
jgi:hypothetical protein